MPRYPYVADIELSKLRLDLRNPRIPDEPDSQRQAFEEMAEVQGAKLLALCKHIAQHGLSPAQRFIVIPDDDNQFIVLDANRRLTAVRALEQPDLVSGRLTEGEMKQLRQLAEDFEPPEDVSCVVFATREDADVWIELLHEGESEGAGLVPWSAQQKTRHRARLGTKAHHLQVLDFVAKEAPLSNETVRRYDRGKYPVSTLERALTTPHVRSTLGIEYSDGEVVTNYPKTEVLKGLAKLVDEIGAGKVKVDKFMTVADRTRYIDRFKDAELPDPSTRMDTFAPLDEAPEKARDKHGAKKEKRSSATRSKLIPSDFMLSIGPARINDIYLELKRKLRVDDVPNAVGVLLRVFLELSVDEYIATQAVTKPKDDQLAKKVAAVVDYMEQKGLMTKKQAVPIREAVKSDDKVNLATNLNALIHNRDMAVGGNDLKALWTRIGPFFQKLWA
jgi:hypothetical protein